MSTLRIFILLLTFSFITKISASSKVEGLAPTTYKGFINYIEQKTVQISMHPDWVWPDPKTILTKNLSERRFLKEIIKSGDQLGLNNINHFSNRGNISTKKANYYSSDFPHFRYLEFTISKDLNPSQKYLLIERKTETFASIFFQTNGMRIPLGYLHESNELILDLIDTYYNLSAKEISSLGERKDIQTFLLRTPYAEKITTEGPYQLSEHIQKNPEIHDENSLFFQNINYYLKKWYEFKNIQVDQISFNSLIKETINTGQLCQDDKLYKVKDSFSKEIQMAQARWDLILTDYSSIKNASK